MIKLFYTSVRVVIRRHHPSVCARLQPVRHYSVKHLQPAQVSFVRQHLSASLFFFLSSSLGQMRARGMGRSRWRWARRWPLLLPVASREFGPHPQDRSIHSLFLFCFSRRNTRALSSATAGVNQPNQIHVRPSGHPTSSSFSLSSTPTCDQQRDARRSAR